MPAYNAAKTLHMTYADLPRDVFVFGYSFDVSSYFERKNPLCLVDAFKREFGNSRDAMLLLQYFNAGSDQDGRA